MAGARGWITDEATLRRVCALGRVTSVQQQCEQRLASWKNGSPLITVHVSRTGAYGRVAQYDFEDFDALQARLSQFPETTTFLLSFPAGAQGEESKVIDNLRILLRERGFALGEESSSD